MRLDPSLVASWSLDLIHDEPFDYPFQASYQFEGKQLTYIASLHSCELDSNTFKMIRQALEKQDIDYVIVEGINYSDGISPAKAIEWAKKQGQVSVFSGFETAFTIDLASQKNISFVGGEPDDQFVLSQVLNEGYSKEDLIFYYFVQQVFQSRENQTFLESALLQSFDDSIIRKNQFFKFENLPRFSDFEKWYRNKNGRQFVASEITSEVPAPFVDGPLFTQKISSAVCKIRDQFTLSCINEAIHKYNSVLVIYGGSHWSTQKNSLQAALGEPLYSAVE